MKRTLITLLAAMFAASGATALSIDINTDSATYAVGDAITITATVVATGGETVPAFNGFNYEISWDPAIAHVANAGVNVAQGNGTQSGAITYGGGTPLTGAALPPCNTNGYSCQFLTQANTTFGTVTLDASNLTATLVLQADAQGALNFGQFIYTDATGGTLTLGSNLQNAQVVPEPTTAALLGLGLLGLGVVGRRR